MFDTDFEPKIEEENFTNEAILEALDEYPLSSLRQIAKRILIPMSAIGYHLVNFLVLKQEHSMGPPFALIDLKPSTCRDESRSSSSSRLVKHYA
jgi:hypothetical protein